ncbi:MAG: DUF1015 domain-containing protein [Acholeplasmataceae bacterium]|nr:DUF1015 domain-containing protein [Acholeplasmataceae bacterium]
MAKFKTGYPIVCPEIYLPKKEIDLKKWAVVACDQFTSKRSYWNDLQHLVGDAPSTLHLILPEIYLGDHLDDRIAKINQTMCDYHSKGLLNKLEDSLILIERTTEKNQKRLGLMVAVDLEAYDYEEGSKPLIRTTEKTIIDRIPPRVRIRKDAPLELSHVMLLVDDDKKRIIENLYKHRNEFPLLYDFELNMKGGHIRGYQIKDADTVISDFLSLIEGEKDPVLFIAGDGNHSLATAKAHWESLKHTLSKEEIKDHPAQYAMVEVVNIYDPGLEFEGIHRVLFPVDGKFYDELQKNITAEKETWVYEQGKGKKMLLIPENDAEAYEEIQQFLDDYLIRNPHVKIDYIHGDDDLIEASESHPNAFGIKMPTIERKAMFEYIKTGKVLPRKSFSMGCATAKRYYLESRIIKK